MQKLYCYVDETGQESKSKNFIVSIILIEKERDQLLKVCEQLEQISGKRKDKWGSAKHQRRMRFLRYVLADDRFKGTLRYSITPNTREYDRSTIEGIVSAIGWKKPKEKFTTVIYVDGLSKTKRRECAVGLRRMGVPVAKVRGIAKDESNALTRLADTIAGFVSDAIKECSTEIFTLYKRALREQVLIEV